MYWIIKIKELITGHKYFYEGSEDTLNSMDRRGTCA
jgi:hypothetical protein